MPRKPKKRCRLSNTGHGCIRNRVEQTEPVWPCDFIFGSTSSGWSLTWLALTDEHTRECLALNVSHKHKRHEDVSDVLRGVFIAHGIPEFIRSDNGPEFIVAGLRSWLNRMGVGSLSTSPGSPWENGYAESFDVG